MSTGQNLIESAKELSSGRLEHLFIDLKTRLNTAEANFNNLEALDIKLHWKDLAALLNNAQMVQDEGILLTAMDEPKVLILKQLEDIKESLQQDNPGFTFDEYQLTAQSTAIYPGQGKAEGLAYVALGLAGEAGEIANKVKKVMRDDGGELTVDKSLAIQKEVGDVGWYLAQLCTELCCLFSGPMEMNNEKLLSRQKRGKLQGSGDNR